MGEGPNRASSFVWSAAAAKKVTLGKNGLESCALIDAQETIGIKTVLCPILPISFVNKKGLLGVSDLQQSGAGLAAPRQDMQHQHPSLEV